MRISDWSSDVCFPICCKLFGGRAVLCEHGGDLDHGLAVARLGKVVDQGETVGPAPALQRLVGRDLGKPGAETGRIVELIDPGEDPPLGLQIGRAACRERVGPYVYISVVAVSFKTNKKN